jgi:hypothetical protein
MRRAAGSVLCKGELPRVRVWQRAYHPNWPVVVKSRFGAVPGWVRERIARPLVLLPFCSHNTPNQAKMSAKTTEYRTLCKRLWQCMLAAQSEGLPVMASTRS